VLGALGTADHVITDPPYDDRTHASAKSSKAGGDGMLGIDFGSLADLDHLAPMLALARGWVLAFCALEQLGAYSVAAGSAWVRAGIWNRLAGTAFARSDRPFQGAEGLAIMSSAAVKVFPAGAKRAVWDCTTEREDRVHPTQKPIDLMLEIVRDFTIADELIFDPFAGSGSTGVAALRLGRRVVLVERDPKYAAFCIERMTAEESDSTLGALRAGQLPLGGGSSDD
jgi:site-specific DNA-methyltransferase (adenine-specific)